MACGAFVFSATLVAHPQHRFLLFSDAVSANAAAWPHRLAPLLELQRTLLAEETKAYADARAAAASDAVDASSGAVAGASAAALHQCNVCALLSHGLAPLLCSLSTRLAQSRHQTSVLGAGDAAGTL